jgi:hypothetical protein
MLLAPSSKAGEPLPVDRHLQYLSLPKQEDALLTLSISIQIWYDTEFERCLPKASSCSYVLFLGGGGREGNEKFNLLLLTCLKVPGSQYKANLNDKGR